MHLQLGLKKVLFLALLVLSIVLFDQLYSLNRPWILVSCVIGFLFASSRFKFWLLTALSICHLSFIVGGSSWIVFREKIFIFILVIAIFLAFLLACLRFSKNWTRLWRVFFVLGIFSGLVILQETAVINWFNYHALTGLKYLVWPSVLIASLDSSMLKKVFFVDYMHRLFPSWHVQLFHNIPTEPQDNWNSELNSEKLFELQKNGLKLILICIGLAMLKTGVDQIWKLDWMQPYTSLRMMWWRDYASIKFSFWEKVAMIYFNFCYMLLNFTILGTFANACAKIWGFNFNLNVNFFLGGKILTQWNLLFHYLNQIIVQVFFNPILEKLNFIRHKKIRLSVAMIISVYVFGFLYILFSSNTHLFNPATRENFMTMRAFYLGLICIFGLVRLWGPKTKRHRFLRVLAPYYYFLIFAPLLMFGMLSMDIHFVPF